MKSYRFALDLYLEWFDDEALLLVGGREVLLTVNRAGGVLFESLRAAFAGRTFTLAEGAGWLAVQYDLAEATCWNEARKLLAFALKNCLVEPVDTLADKTVHT